VCNPLGGVIFGAVLGALVASAIGRGPSAATPPPAPPGGAAAAVIEVESEDQFRGLVKGGGVLLVDFYADWCGPCRMLKPTIHQVAEAQADRVKVLAVNVDRLGSLAQEYGVRSIPDVKVIKDGRVEKTLIGVQGRAVYEQALEEALGGGAAPSS
jgi:thioredoxin 1